MVIMMEDERIDEDRPICHPKHEYDAAESKAKLMA
jgi:hypothetical protein